jgi:hypothetical protein
MMKSLNQLLLASSAGLVLLGSVGCMSTGPATAQSQDEAWCSSHPKQCDNKDWCAKNPGKCSTASTSSN